MRAPIVGGRPPNDDVVYKIRYSTEKKGGGLRTVTCYTTNYESLMRRVRKQGDRVTYVGKFVFQKELHV